MSQKTISLLLDAAFQRLGEPGAAPAVTAITRRELAEDMVRILHAARADDGAVPGNGHPDRLGEPRLEASDDDLGPWRCFHCKAHFTDRDEAALHFGRTERQSPACQVSPERLRELEEVLSRYQEDDTDLHRQISALQNAEQRKLRTAEEHGYARGLRDAVRYPVDALGLVRYVPGLDGELTPRGDGTVILVEDLADQIQISCASERAHTATPDERAVDRFSLALKAHMAALRVSSGQQDAKTLGWDEAPEWDFEVLARHLAQALRLGDPVGVGAMALMMQQREALAMEHHPCNGGYAAKALQSLLPEGM